MSKNIKPRNGGDKTSLNPPTRRPGRKKPRGGSETTENKVPKHATNPAGQSASPQLRLRTAEDVSKAQTVESLALRIWTAMVAEKVLSGMSALMDELLESHLLDDDDEEADEGWLDDHHKREKKLLDEAIADGLDKYPDINASMIFPRAPIQTLLETPGS